MPEELRAARFLFDGLIPPDPQVGRADLIHQLDDPGLRHECLQHRIIEEDVAVEGEVSFVQGADAVAWLGFADRVEQARHLALGEEPLVDDVAAVGKFRSE